VLHELLNRSARVSACLCLMLVSGLAQSQGAEPAQTSSDMLRSGREGATLGDTLRRTAPRTSYDPEQGVIRIEGVDRIQLEQLTGATEPHAAAVRERLGQLQGLSAEELDRAGKEAAREMERNPTMVGSVHRLVRNQREDALPVTDNDPVLGESRAILQSVLTGSAGVRAEQGNLASDALESYTDCATDVTVRDGAPAVAGELSTEVCEVLRERPPVVRERRVEVETVELPLASYTNMLVARSLTVPIDVRFPDDALNPSFGFSWAGTVADVELLEAPDEANGHRARFSVVYNTAACEGVPEDQPCARRIQTVRIDFAARYQQISEELVCTEEDCLLASDGFATAEWMCTDDLPRTIEGVTIDGTTPGLEPLFPDASTLCWRAEARYRHTFAEGRMCWDSPTGRQCFDQAQPAAGTTTCPRIVALTASGDVSCWAAERSCVEDGRGHNDFCYVESVAHSCRTNVRYRNIRLETTNRCGTAMSCMGAECAPQLQQAINQAGNVDVAAYGRQQAYGLLVHHILNDYTPTPAGPYPALIFDGRPRECRKALGGPTDCCIAEVPGAQALWFGLYTRAQRTQHAATAHALADREPGTAVALSSGFVAPGALDRAFISDRETVEGGSTQPLSSSATSTAA
jgi:hypothetical protein